MKNIPLLIPNYNQLTYLLNIINWWKFYYPDNPVHIIDNGSNYQPLLDFYGNRQLFYGVEIFRYIDNECSKNLKIHLKSEFMAPYDYYVISDPDVMPCPDVPPNFLEIFKHCIDHYGYNHVGFCLKIDDLPDFIDNKPEILFNEQGFWKKPVKIEHNAKEYTGYKEPIDTTFSLYKKSAGWEKPMPDAKWSSALRIFNAYHLMWYLSPANMNPEMYHYFKTAKYRIPGVSSTGVNNYRPKKPIMKNEYYADIVTTDLLSGAVENNEFKGFREDYHVLHCLMRKQQPASIFEIGTNRGVGTKILCNAVPLAVVYTLDLPTELCHISLQHPIMEGKGDCVGSACDLAFTQLRGDSMNFNFSEIPCEAYFIDGEHTQVNVQHETTEVLKNKPKMIVWHDADIQEVDRGILAAFDGNTEYDLHRVLDTRIAYALLK